ncbi:MAG: hypothetical protein SNJ54_15230, partial [Anaerolineae bacterium]
MTDTRRGLIPEDLMKFRWLEELAIAPDARAIAYTIKVPHAATNGYLSHLYVRSLDGGAPQRLTDGVSAVSSIAWSRDSQFLAFSYKDEVGASVRVVHLASGLLNTFLMPEGALGGLDWSPDGTKLVGTRWTLARREGDTTLLPSIPAPDIRVVRRLRYKQDGSGWVHDRFSQVYVLEVSTGELTQITDS